MTGDLARSVVLIGALGLSGSGVWAQKETSGLPASNGAAVDPVAEVTVDASRLGISVERIRMRAQRASQAGSPFSHLFDADTLRLSTFVDVVAKAPPLQLFGPDPSKELTAGPVPWSVPTHQELLNVMTPPEFRNKAVDMGALLEWLREQLGGHPND